MSKALRSVKEPYLFTRAYHKGKSAVRPTVVLYLLPRKAGIPFSLGITVSKKLGNSPARSRAKRVIRESMRLILREQPQLAGKNAALIVVARSRAFSFHTKMQSVRADMESGLRELQVL